MKSSRRKVTIKNIAEPEHRPARQFVDIIKSMVTDSAEILKTHPIYYRTAKSKFELLNTAYQEINDSLSEAELKRDSFVCSNKLKDDLDAARKELENTTKAMNDIENGVMKRHWQDEAVKITANLHHLQMDILNQQSTRAIELYRQLRVAEGRLYELRRALDHMHRFPAKKYKLAQQAVTHQQIVVAQLDAYLNVRHETPELTALQNDLNTANANIKLYTENHEEMLAKAFEKLKTARLTLTNAEAAINHEQMRHYANVSATIMHGIVRVYDRFITYKLAFDSTVKDRLTNKDAVAAYQQQLEARKIRLEQLMTQLWCQELNEQTASQIYDELSNLPHQDRVNVLVQKPDGAAIVSKPETPRVSDVGLFTHKLTTAEKRKYLVRTNGQVTGRTMPKL